MKKIEVKPSFVDARGSITDLISDGEINSVTLITFSKDAVRGNHYHERTIQWNYIISGEVLLVTQFPGESRYETILKNGDLVVTREQERHALKAITESEVLIITKGPRAGTKYEQDTFRLEVPLIERT
jgi:quercetin dioxygenase-like cupin family protein